MKKVKYPNLNDYDLSDYVELKGDILYKINGGAEIENSVEAQAQAHEGDTVTRNDGTTYTLTSGDIKWAQDYVGSSGNAGTTDGNSGQVCLSAETGISSQSTNSNGGTATASTTAVSGGTTDSSSTQTSKSGTAKKIPIDHARNNELVDGWYEDCVTNLIARANGGIAGKEIMGMSAGYEIDHENKIIVTSVSDKKSSANDDGIIWSQVGAGAFDMLLGIGSVAGGAAISVGSGGGLAAMGYIVALEGMTAFCYGLAEVGTGFQGKRIPGSTAFTEEQVTFGLAKSDFDMWEQ